MSMTGPRSRQLSSFTRPRTEDSDIPDYSPVRPGTSTSELGLRRDVRPPTSPTGVTGARADRRRPERERPPRGRETHEVHDHLGWTREVGWGEESGGLYVDRWTVQVCSDGVVRTSRPFEGSSRLHPCRNDWSRGLHRPLLPVDPFGVDTVSVKKEERDLESFRVSGSWVDPSTDKSSFSPSTIERSVSDLTAPFQPLRTLYPSTPQGTGGGRVLSVGGTTGEHRDVMSLEDSRPGRTHLEPWSVSRPRVIPERPFDPLPETPVRDAADVQKSLLVCETSPQTHLRHPRGLERRTNQRTLGGQDKLPSVGADGVPIRSHRGGEVGETH